MFANRPFAAPADPLKEVEYMLDRWFFAASSDGTLWIGARRDVAYADFAVLMKRLSETLRGGLRGKVILFFESALHSHRHWPDMARLVASFAHHWRATWRLVETLDAESGNRSSVDTWLPPRRAAVRMPPPHEPLSCIVFEGRVAGPPLPAHLG